MANENPMGRGAAVALEHPVDQVRFLRRVFQDARAGVREELDDSDRNRGSDHLRREDAAYGRLLEALDELVIVPDADVRDVVGDLAHIIDRENEYTRVLVEHAALHGLLALLEGGGR